MRNDWLRTTRPGALLALVVACSLSERADDDGVNDAGRGGTSQAGGAGKAGSPSGGSSGKAGTAGSATGGTATGGAGAAAGQGGSAAGVGTGGASGNGGSAAAGGTRAGASGDGNSGGSGTGGASGGAGTAGSGASGGAAGSAGAPADMGCGRNPGLASGKIQMENLCRGVVAVRSDDANFVSWRMFGYEPETVAYNVYRNGTKVTATPIEDSTNYLDGGAPANATYTVRAVIDGVEQPDSEEAATCAQNYLTIPLTATSGSTPGKDRKLVV
jgi:hypothetical protein